ncbi:MAG: hypothetical protein K0B15_11805 [Lentimicrobium sp.]|nr:hypothetical protein [Lentimicrobium sp.]
MITFIKKPLIVALCDNPMIFRIATDLPTGTENISVYIDPYYSVNNIYLGREVLYPAPLGTADVDLSDYFISGLQQTKQFHFPEQGNVPWSIRPNLCKQYKLLINETWGENSQHHTTLEQRYVVKGKIPEWKKNSFYAQYTSFLQWVISAKSFLTFSPDSIQTKKEQIQKLYFLVYWLPQTGKFLNLKVNLYFTDNTTNVYYPAQQTVEINAYNIIEFSVGYSILNLGYYISQNHPGKILESYDVTVMNLTEEVSQTKTFLMDYKINLAERQFIFANSLAGYDTFLATGISELTSEYDYINVDQQSPGLLELPNKKTGFIKTSEYITARTGYVSADTIFWLAEFFESKEVYEIIGSNLYQIVFHDSKILRKKDSTNIFFAEFEYEYSIKQYVETE